MLARLLVMSTFTAMHHDQTESLAWLGVSAGLSWPDSSEVGDVISAGG
jgi:hypothetical protein